MLFSSIPFLFYFLPCMLLLYALSPKKLKNFTLLVCSLVFYAWGEPRLVVLMLITVFIVPHGTLLSDFAGSIYGNGQIAVFIGTDIVLRTFPLLAELNDTALAQHTKMVRHRRLTHAENIRHFTDAHLRQVQHGQQAYTR